MLNISGRWFWAGACKIGCASLSASGTPSVEQVALLRVVIVPASVSFACNTGADPFGFPTLFRPWDDGTDSIENAKRRLRVAFEFFQKLGIKLWSFHDR